MNRLGKWCSAAAATAFAFVALAQGCGSGTAIIGSQGTTGVGGAKGTTTTVGATGQGGSLSIAGAVGSAAGAGGASPCNPACTPQEVCSHDVCVPGGACKTDNDCVNDTYCDSAGMCAPWTNKHPADDTGCVNVIAPGVFSPKVRCEFSTPPKGDAFPLHVDVQATPLVVNFNKPSSAGPPSIVAPFTATVVMSYTEGLGILRVLSGKDCSLEANLGGVDLDGDGNVDWIVSSSTPAAGDLDGDGVAEIVAYGSDGATLAFTKKKGKWQLLWKSPYTAGQIMAPCTANNDCPGGWGGPSIHDINDDGVPEIIREGTVISAKGVVMSGPPPGYVSASQGLFSVVANLEGTADVVQMTNGQYIWAWKAGAWVQEPNFPGANASAAGHVAVADFGAYGMGLPAKSPEIVSVENNQVTIYAADGSYAMPPVPVPGKGGGGPPTIADFDGDGLPEVGIAGEGFYTVYDIDCGPNPRPGGKCALGPCDALGATCPKGGYMLWSRTSQDYSSNITGSSVFDFEASGTADVVYGDECFIRVYDGKNGDVLFSQYHSSCTWCENPVVADVEGNFRSNLVTPSNEACSDGVSGILCQQLDQYGVDAMFPGLRCKTNADCVSASCESGFCRCTSGAQCCAAMTVADCLEDGFSCVPPPMGTPGTGNTCRAAHPHGLSGIRVYSDANDKWVRSRQIWNQHPYAVTNVNEDGTVPKTSAWTNNWDDPTLNNFRQNVPGVPNGLATGDATAGPSNEFLCTPTGVTLSAPVCNRGAAPIAAGLSVGFYTGKQKVCGTTTMQVLQPAACETVSCVWPLPPQSQPAAINVSVVPNDAGKYAECNTKNDTGTIFAVFCVPTM